MKMIYYMALVEYDQDKVDGNNGPQIVRVMDKLVHATGDAGKVNLYQVKDEAAFLKFKADLRRGAHS